MMYKLVANKPIARNISGIKKHSTKSWKQICKIAKRLVLDGWNVEIEAISCVRCTSKNMKK